MGRMLLLILLLSPAAGAEEDRRLDDCLEASGGATHLVSSCLKEALERKERRLHRTLNQALERLPKSRRAELERIQRLWLEYRDAYCGFLYHPRSGSGGLLDMQECLLEETRRRNRTIEETIP